MRNTCCESNMAVPLKLFKGASAAKAVIQSQGEGRRKHLDTKALCIQERDKEGDCATFYIPRLEHCSDFLSHHCIESESERLFLIRRSRPGIPDPCDVREGVSEIGHTFFL